MKDQNNQLFARITNTMREWRGEDNLDDYHIGLLADMVTFASIPISVGALDTPGKLVNQLTEVTKAAFNLGYAKSLSDNAPQA